VSEHVPLPELETGELDERTIDQLFEDIARDAVLVAVLLKGGAEAGRLHEKLHNFRRL
jgi:hypothetical protein